jgi:predicted RNase H-like HicB family nuclease
VASAKFEVMDLPIILTAGDDGYLVAQCPVIPGCISQGRTREETLANIREAIELRLENRDNEDWDLPAEYEIVRLSIA